MKERAEIAYSSDARSVSQTVHCGQDMVHRVKMREYVMVNVKHPIFRKKAIQQYAQNLEKDVLPRTATPPVFLCLWILLGLLLAAAITAWLGQVPVFVAGSGIIQGEQGKNNAVAVVFLPANALSTIRIGQAVQLHIASTGQSFKGTIDKIEPGIISPIQARQQYHLGDAGPQIVSGPSVVVIVTPESSLSMSTYAGSIVSAQAQVGSQRILSLLPGLTALIGG